MLSTLRLLRAVKHRFGATDQLGLFEMTGDGLVGVPDPSRLFLADRRKGVSGSVVVPTMEGHRPLLVELQALVTRSNLPRPRRSAQGLDTGRLSLLLAVLAERMLSLSWAPGDALFTAGELSAHVFVLAAGQAKAFRSTSAGQATSLDFLGPGDVLGGLTALDAGHYAETAVALVTTCALRLDVRSVNGRAGLLATRAGRPAAVLAFEGGAEGIEQVWIVTNPAKLDGWS